MAGGGRTWTVLGDDHLPIAPIEEFLEHHRVLGSSPNTVRSYAKGLQLWWVHLAREGVGWEDPSVGDAAGVRDLAAHRALTGGRADRPGGCGRALAPAEATVQARLAAVVSFYRFQHDVHGRGAALARASMRRSGRVATGRCSRTWRAAATGAASPLRLRTPAPARRRC